MREANDADLEEVNRVISARGYLVIETWVNHDIGDRIDEWVHNGVSMITHPLTVVAETDQDDLIAQMAMWGTRPAGETGRHWWRCITD